MLCFLLIIVIIALILLNIGYWLFYFTIVRSRRPTPKYGLFESKTMKRSLPRLSEYGGQIRAGMEWFDSMSPERVQITARDGTRLVGYYLPAENEKGLVILFHGYRSYPSFDFSCAFRFYHELGYSIINVHQRAHGESGGKYITFGIKERFDCLDWTLYANDRFGSELNIFLGGLSMGATTVLMAAGTGLPANVRGIIADCGFTSPYDEFKAVLSPIPTHPILDIAEFFAARFAGFRFDDYSTVTAMSKNTIPTLFIHGEADNFVPTEFTRRNYEACAGEKYILTVPGAGHGISYLLDPTTCRTLLRKFLAGHTR